MAEAFAKFRVGTPGAGAAHAAYITRASALEPNNERTEARQLELADAQTSVPVALEQDLKVGTIEHSTAQEDADPVWTWNAPSYLTGDHDGIQHEQSLRALKQIGERDRALHEKMTAGINSPDRAARLQEKISKVRAFFGSMEQFEKAKGGRTHYRVILSFDVPATNSQIRDLTNEFLRETFPKAIAFGAIHRDTNHPHVHLYLHARQTDGRKIYLARNQYTSIDEKWAKIYSDFAGERSVYIQHLRKKEETRQWKIAAAEAYRKGEPIPPKPERDNDRRERLAEQRLSAQRSEARDRGQKLDARPQAEPVIRPASEKETSRLLAKNEIAREQLAHLIRTDARETEIKSASRIANDLDAVLDKTLVARKEVGKENPPQVVYTTEEWKQLKECRASNELPARDDHAAARLEAARVLAGAELKDAQGKAEAFQVSRHFWKFDVEGWDRQLSLKEVEQAVKEKTAEKLKLYNFLRPTVRETIEGQIDYLNDVKKDVQKQLAAKEQLIDKTRGAAEFRYDMTTRQVQQARKTRAERGQEMLPPIHHTEELIRMDAIANRNKDANLLQYVYSQIRESVLENPSPQALSRIRGRALSAKLDMLKESERFKDAVRYRDFRQFPLKDAQGFDYTKSIREVSPRGALETIIRYFTDTSEQKQEQRALLDAARFQQEKAEKRVERATSFSYVMDRILEDHCHAAGVSPEQIVPTLNAQQIAEIRDFAEKMPYSSTMRKEFSDAANQAERWLEDRAAAAARETQPISMTDRSITPVDQTLSQPDQSIDQGDRDTSSRGR